MSEAAGSGARAPAAWIIVAHTLGAIAIGALDTARIGSLPLALSVVPIFAATGLIAGSVIAGASRLVSGRSWWLVALVLATPALVVYVPLARSLFLGAFAQTLPLAGAAPYVLPIVLWLGTAVAIALGRLLLRDGDLGSRAIGVLVLAGLIGGIVWVVRHVLGSGYPTAHKAATLAIIVIAGIGVRITRRAGLSPIIAAVVAAIVIGIAAPSVLTGLRSPAVRTLLATFGDQSRDLIGLWRSILDFDRDGTSAVLGGGDCDDLDATRRPGALDTPGDGIDQDCDGTDAVLVAAEKPSAALASDLASWRATPEVAAILQRTKDMNVLMITVDALRADMLAPEAAHREDFPNITKLLGESVWFTRAFAPGAGTDISLTTLLTGRFDPFQRIALTLPEALRAAGRKTYAALPAEVLRYAGEVMLGRGVDTLAKVHTDWGKADVGDHVSAAATTLEGVRALDDLGDKRGFVWLHYFDVHEHHQIKVPKRLLESVRDGGSEKHHAYRGLLRTIDDELGRLLGELDKRKLLDRTIIVFASDHGESLGEDRRLGDTHGKVTYAALVRIPIAFRIPGIKPVQRTELASLVDLAPTLLDLLGITPANMPLDGHNLVPSLLDGPLALRSPPRALVIHEELQWSVVEWPYQLIVQPAENLVELYDLEQDPAQQRDLSGQHPDVVARLKARYAAVPPIRVDRTPSGRSWREQQARPPQRPAP